MGIRCLCQRWCLRKLDIAIYILGLILPFCLTLMALLVNLGKGAGNILLGGMSALGGLVGGWFFLAVGADGSITETSGTIVNAIASSGSANGATWQFLIYLPLILAFMSFMAALYRVWGSISIF